MQRRFNSRFLAREVQTWRSVPIPFATNVYFALSRRYAQAVAPKETSSASSKDKFADKLQSLKVDRAPKHPRVFLREESEAQRVGKAKKLLNDFKPVAHPPGASLHQLNDVLEICASLSEKNAQRNSLVDQALSKIDSCTGSVIALTRTIKFLGQLKKYPEAMSVAESFKQKNLVPSPTTVNTIIKACGQNGKVEKAWEIFDAVKPGEKTPATFAAVVDALARNNKLDEAKDLIRKMEPEYKVKPNFRVFRRYLLQCVVTGEKTKGLAMLEYMNTNRVKLAGAQLKWMTEALEGKLSGIASS